MAAKRGILSPLTGITSQLGNKRGSIDPRSLFFQLRRVKMSKNKMQELKSQMMFEASRFTEDENYWMRANGLYCGLNMPDALKSNGNGENEVSHQLPPYAKRKAFLVDKYPACPDEWMRSEGSLTSYFVPVIEGNGMWLDFNKIESPFHIAAVVSIQGVNAVTGLPCKDAQLEQYKEKCPKHNVAFGPDRFCSKCNFKWPKQNYICTTGTPHGMFWLDGFRTAEGVVRQYILTAEKMRGVASNIIGKDRVFAIGVSFFLSKEQCPVARREIRSRSVLKSLDCSYDDTPPDYSNYLSTTGTTYYGPDDALTKTYKGISQLASPTHCYTSSVSTGKMGEPRCLSLGVDSVAQNVHYKSTPSDVRMVTAKKLEVGAGAKISQTVYDDPNGLDYWRDKPEAILCINYCLETTAREIIEAGKIDLEGSKEAFLEGIPVGN